MPGRDYKLFIINSASWYSSHLHLIPNHSKEFLTLIILLMKIWSTRFQLFTLNLKKQLSYCLLDLVKEVVKTAGETHHHVQLS